MHEMGGRRAITIKIVRNVTWSCSGGRKSKDCGCPVDWERTVCVVGVKMEKESSERGMSGGVLNQTFECCH